MQRRLRTIFTSLLSFCLSAGILSVSLWAHGGFDHVQGTVSKLDANVLTVKTAKGDVNVKLNAKTEIMMGDHKAAAADLKVGVRVVVDIPEGSKDNVAHSVKIGTAPVAGGAAADQHGHDAHK
jgi:hypothetical protein